MSKKRDVVEQQLVTIAARRVATKIWAVLTGEPPPPAQKAEEDAAQVRVAR